MKSCCDYYRLVVKQLALLTRWASGLTMVRQFLLLFYLLSAHIITFSFCRYPWVSRILIRRPKVFDDGLPGSSDLDLTIVFRPTEKKNRLGQIRMLVKLNRCLKLLFPMLGETWFIPEMHFYQHLNIQVFDYGLPFGKGLLYARTREEFELVNKWKGGWLWRAAFIYRQFYIPSLVNKDYWNCGKAIEKIKQLLNYSNTLTDDKTSINWPGIAYCKLYGSGNGFHLSPAQLQRQQVVITDLMTQALSSIDRNSRIIPVQVCGSLSLSQLEVDLTDQLLQILPDNTLVIPGRVRLFHFEKLLVIINPNHQAIIELLRGADKVNVMLKALGFSVLTMTGWEQQGCLIRVDPIAHFLFSQSAAGVIPVPVGITIEFLQLEFCQIMSQIYSLLRYENSFRYLDLIFGRLLSLRCLLQKGELVLSLSDLLSKLNIDFHNNSYQNEILDAYRRGDKIELDKHKTLDLWWCFAPFIEDQLKLLHKELDVWLATTSQSSP